MIVIASSRKVRRFVGGVLFALVMFGLLGGILPNVIFRCPCGLYTVWGIIIGCNPCWAHLVVK